MMSDIVTELRGMKWMVADEMRGMVECDLPQRAASEIERLRTRTFTKADVEAAAISIYETRVGQVLPQGHVIAWDSINGRDIWRSLAHAALPALGEVE
jgi:hypothetical protein